MVYFMGKIMAWWPSEVKAYEYDYHEFDARV